MLVQPKASRGETDPQTIANRGEVCRNRMEPKSRPMN